MLYFAPAGRIYSHTLRRPAIGSQLQYIFVPVAAWYSAYEISTHACTTGHIMSNIFEEMSIYIILHSGRTNIFDYIVSTGSAAFPFGCPNPSLIHTHTLWTYSPAQSDTASWAAGQSQWPAALSGCQLSALIRTWT